MRQTGIQNIHPNSTKMKNFFTCLLLIFSYTAFAQYEAVVFDYELAYFNNGQPLPAESHLMFSGAIEQDVQWVEISIHKAKSSNPLYEAYWKRKPNDRAENFQLPINFKLAGNSNYDIRINYYEEMEREDRNRLKVKLGEIVKLYLDQAIIQSEKDTKLSKSANQTIKRLNDQVYEVLESYRFRDEVGFSGFSSVVKDYLKSLEKQSAENLPENSISDEKINKLERLLIEELNMLLAKGVYNHMDMRMIKDYPTEKVQGSLAINVGYGGVYLGGKAEQLSYASAPYVGLSFPFSQRATAPGFFRNTSITLGAFIENFEDVEGNELSGPIFGRPYFVGMGYKILRFVRLNGGLVVLEQRGNSDITNGQASLQVENIKLQPFLGVSAEFNLSIGLGKK